MQQSFITSTSSKIRINVRLVRASQFFRQFCLVVRHKPGKKHIISNALSRLATANVLGHLPSYSEVNALFVYHTMLVKVKPDLVSLILEGYKAENWWARV